MKKKLLSVLLALVLALSLCLMTAVPAAAATINVSSGGDIQAAIDTATAGDIINVAAGTCTENIDVNKRVILQAIGTVTVNPASASDHIFHVTVSNVTIDGFTLVGDTLDPTSRGILLDGVTDCTITNNNWSSTANAMAICLDGADGNIIQGNTCAFTVTTSGYGIYLLLADSNLVKDNICTGGSENIWIEGSDNTIQGNTCSGSSIGNGIMLSGATEALTGNTLKGNTCSNNDANGISIIAWPNSISDTDVIGNTLTGNSNGILLDSDSGAVLSGITITENTCQSNTNGIKVFDVYAGSDITIIHNDISSNTAVGILIDDSWGNANASLVIVSPDNNIVNNTDYGVENQDTANSLDATVNWWGTTDGGQIPAMISGDVTHTSHLTTAPAAVGMTAETDTLPTVATSAASAVVSFTATLNGNLSDMGTADSVDVWFEWGTTTGYGQTTPFETKATDGTFAAGLTGLAQGTEYHFMAVARSADGTTTGLDVSFTTPIVPPVVTTGAATSLGLYSATLNGNLTVFGGVSPVAVSFQWDIDSGETYANETTPVNVTTTGTFSAALTNLTPDETYYFRAKAVGISEVFGAELSFTTVAEIIGISVSPTSIDFGSILAGQSSAPQTVTVTNEGNIAEKFTATLTDESPAGFYTANLAIATITPVTDWSVVNIAVDATSTPGLILSMPTNATAGPKTATIIFWAEATP